jgi:hypothetical protein
VALAFPKGRPRRLDRQDRQQAVDKLDRAENAKVKQRSGGYCEVQTPFEFVQLCGRKASEVHHLLGGIGRRNVGRSILAECKLHVCTRCHGDISGHVLKPINQQDSEWADKVRYERVR